MVEDTAYYKDYIQCQDLLIKKIDEEKGETAL